MPALKSIANHESIPNSGCSSSRPNRMLPMRLIIRGGSRVDHGKGDQGKDHYRRGDEHGFP
jgi:hypothetical protein